MEQKIEIKSEHGRTKVFVDGKKIDCVRRLSLNQIPGELPVLTLDLNALNLTVDAHAVLQQEGYGEIEIKLKEPSSDGSGT